MLRKRFITAPATVARIKHTVVIRVGLSGKLLGPGEQRHDQDNAYLQRARRRLNAEDGIDLFQSQLVGLVIACANERLDLPGEGAQVELLDKRAYIQRVQRAFFRARRAS